MKLTKTWFVAILGISLLGAGRTQAGALQFDLTSFANNTPFFNTSYEGVNLLFSNAVNGLLPVNFVNGFGGSQGLFIGNASMFGGPVITGFDMTVTGANPALPFVAQFGFLQPILNVNGTAGADFLNISGPYSSSVNTSAFPNPPTFSGGLFELTNGIYHFSFTPSGNLDFVTLGSIGGVPEPETTLGALFAAGVGMIGLKRRKRRSGLHTVGDTTA